MAQIQGAIELNQGVNGGREGLRRELIEVMWRLTQIGSELRERSDTQLTYGRQRRGNYVGRKAWESIFRGSVMYGCRIELSDSVEGIKGKPSLGEWKRGVWLTQAREWLRRR